MKKAVIAVITCIFFFGFISFAYAEQERAGVAIQIQELKDDLQTLKEEKRMLNQDINNFSMNLRELIRERKEAKLEIKGKNITIKELTEEQKEIIAERISAKTGLNLTAEDIDNKTMLRAYLSNGRKALIKIMPDTASERAIERLKLKFCNETNNCTIELRERQRENKTRAVYALKATKEKRVWFFWKKKVQVETEIEAETD